VEGCLVAVLSALWLGRWLDRTVVERRWSDDRLRELRDTGEFFDHASFGAWIGSADGVLKRVNEAFAQMHGCTRAEAEGRPLTEFFPENRREELARNIRIVHDRGHCRWESENLRKDGTTFPVLVDSGAVYGPDGKVRFRATYIQDITEDKRAEVELARLAAIVRSTDDATMSTTIDGIVVDWNHAAERVFGYTAEEMIGRPMDRIVPEDRRAEQDALIAKTMAGEPVVGFETIRVRKDGQHIPIALTKSVVRDSSGRVNGISSPMRSRSCSRGSRGPARRGAVRFQDSGSGSTSPVGSSRHRAGGCGRRAPPGNKPRSTSPFPGRRQPRQGQNGNEARIEAPRATSSASSRPSRHDRTGTRHDDPPAPRTAAAPVMTSSSSSVIASWRNR